MKMFSVTVLSPGKMLYEGDAGELTLPAKEGAMTVLPAHAPALVALKKGTIKVIADSSKRSFDINGGFAEISKKDPAHNTDGKCFVNIFVRQDSSA